MQLSITQENLNKALSATSRVISSRPSLPVLSNLLLKTENKRLKISSTNLEIGVNYWIGAKVDKDGEITVPARLLSEYISSLPAGNINLRVEKQSLHVEAEHYQSTINGIDAAEFPSIPQVDKGTAIKLPAAELRAALSQVVMAVSNDDARPVLNGVYLYGDGDTIVLVATDSYRLAEKRLKLAKNSLKKPLALIIPARTMQELGRSIEDDAEEVELRAESNQAMFKFNDNELVSRLIEGQFPDYRQLIPKQAGTTVTIKTAEFVNITKVASLFARENAGSITLKVDSKTGSLSIRSVASQLGENTSEAQVEVDGEDSEVTLNSRYLLEALSAISQEEVRFAITGKVNPCVLRPIGDKDYLHIVMPLRS